MAKPSQYPDWATDDVNLPGTGNTNKVQTRAVIQTTGWDYGQIPTAEELNWYFNNLGLWVRYFADEYLPTIPNTYLPKTGTSAVFSGDLTGTLSWTGTNAGAGNIQVVDNSHNHISSNITDATDQATANMIAKRASNGSLQTGRAHYVTANDSQNADYFLTNNTGTIITGSVNYSQINDTLSLYKGTPTAIQSHITLNPTYIEMTSPRTADAQETQPGSLVRYDYLNTQVSNLNTTLTDYVNTTAIIGIRQTAEVAIGSANFVDYSNGRRAVIPAGAFLNSLADVQTGQQWLEDVDQVWYKYLQYNINGTWYTIGSL